MSSLLSRYEVRLIHPDAGTRVVTPNQPDLQIESVSIDGQIVPDLVLRDGIRLWKADAEWIFAIENDSEWRCSPLRVEVEDLVSSTVVVTSFAFMSDASFNLDRCTAVLRLKANDSDLLKKQWEREYNILSSDVTKVAVRLNFKSISGAVSTFETLDTDETINIAFPGSQQFLNPDFPDELSGWFMVSDRVQIVDGGPTGLQAKRFSRFMREKTTALYASPSMPPGGGNPGGWAIDFEETPASPYRYVRLIQSQEMEAKTTTVTRYYGDTPFEWSYDEYEKTFYWLPLQESIDNGVPIGIALSKCLGSTGLQVVSNVLNLDPDGGTPTNAVYSSDELHRLIVFSRSDIKLPGASNNATILSVSLKKILDFLRDKYELYWSLEPGNVLRIEHFSYYEDSTIALDLTASQWAPFLKGKRAYTYDENGFPSAEAWTEAADDESMLLPFRSWGYDYQLPETFAIQNCLTGSGSVDTKRLDHVADVISLGANPDKFSSEGFCIVSTFAYSSQRMINADYFTKTANYAVSNRSVVFRHVRWNRWFQYGKVTGNPDELVSTELELYALRLRKNQTEITLKIPITQIALLALYITNLGSGRIKSFSYSLLRCEAKIVFKL